MKKGIITAIFLAALLFATESYSLNELLVIQRGIVHASGSKTRVSVPKPSSSTSTPTPSRGKSVRQMTGRYSGKKTVNNGNAEAPVTSYSIQGGGTGRSGSVNHPGISGLTEDVEDLIDRLADVQERRRVVVIADNGKTRFEAEAMSSGTDDQLRFETESGRVFIDINSISKISFGEKDLNTLPLTVTLLSGKTLNGNIYVKYVLEFLSEDTIIATYANQLNSIRFMEPGAK